MPPRKPIQRLSPSTSDDAAADHRRRLVMLRNRLEKELKTATTAYVAGIARQLQAVLNELATMRDPDAEPSHLDMLVARRDARRAAAKGTVLQEDDGAG